MEPFSFLALVARVNDLAILEAIARDYPSDEHIINANRMRNLVRDMKSEYAYLARIKPGQDKRETAQRLDPDDRRTFFSGDARVDLKIHESCKVCRGSGATCYRARIRTPHYDWRTKSTRLVSMRLRHLHLSRHDESRMSVDSPEAFRAVARAAFAFGSYWDSEYGKEHGIREEDAQAVSDAIVNRSNGDGTIVLNDERYDSFADGGYPIIYVSREGDVFCGKCAPRHVSRETGSPFYEGSPEFCADCNEEIESAYGDPDADDDSGDSGDES
jgi:hypothetical protein